jgi:hypothetical protein
MYPYAAVYTYARNPLAPGGWSRVGVGLTSGLTFGQFGSALALNGDASTLVVGAYSEPQSNGKYGAVYIYTAPAGSGLWNLQHKLNVSDDVTWAGVSSFGISAALSASGDTLAVGATGSRPAVVVFGRDAGGTWTNQSGLIEPTIVATGFSWSLSMNAAGDALAIGAPYDDGDLSKAGNVYTMTRSASGVWGPLRTLIVSDSAAPIQTIGFSVSMAAQGSLVVGAPRAAPSGAWWSVLTVDNGTPYWRE